MNQKEFESVYKLLVFAGNIDGHMTYGELDMLTRVAKSVVKRNGYDPSILIDTFTGLNGSQTLDELKKILTLLNQVTQQEKEIITKWVINMLDADEYIDNDERNLLYLIHAYWGVDVLSILKSHYKITEA